MEPLVLPSYVAGFGQGSTQVMPGTGQAVPGGVEATFEFNGLYMNIRQWYDTFLVTTVDGLSDADVRDTRDINPSDHGETPFNSFYGGRTITLSGKIRANNLQKMRDLIQAMRTAFGDLSREYPLYIRTGDSRRDVLVNCKKIQPLVVPETQADFTHRRDFQVSLRASNPRMVSFNEKYTLAPVNASPTSVVLTNVGNADSRPRMQLIGPITNPVITNLLTGQSVTLNTTIGSGNLWNIDMNAKTIVDHLGANRFDVFDPNAQWLDIKPGQNTIQITGTGISAGTTQMVFYVRDTWL